MLLDRQSARPARVGYALIAFGLACAASALGLFVNQVLFHGSGVGPGPALGAISVAIQAMVLVLVARGVPGSRLLVVLFLLLAALPLPLLGRLIAGRSLFSASYLALGFGLKAVAAWLLFTGASSAWFASRRGVDGASLHM